MCYDEVFYRQQELVKKARERARTWPSTELAPTTIQPARSAPATGPRKIDEEVERELETA